jgi:adenylosuccinate lyase
MKFSALKALSPLDGRYAEKVADLRMIFSEFALMRYRILVEVRWLQHLHRDLSDHLMTWLDHLYNDFDETAAAHIKNIEQSTNHDMKAVEYYLREKIAQHPDLKSLSPWIHFGCTSDDINNLAYGIMFTTARQQIILPLLDELLQTLTHLAHDYADQAMLSHTHGQPATPTTVGKEFANVVSRLRVQRRSLVAIQIRGKLNGTVGNFNAQQIALPDKAWPTIAKIFVESLGLTYQDYTTQIEPHDYIAEISHNLIRLNTILIDFSRDMWGYIALGYFKQKTVASEIGSSTMPHKINPIDFENSEGNLYIANSLFNCFAEKLPLSRWQRDLVNSTMMRNIGVAIGHSMLAYHSLLRGCQKMAVNQLMLQEDLNQHWEVLAEAIQTVMRAHGLEDAYEELKSLTRGKKNIDAKLLHNYIDQTALPENIKTELKKLTPATYVGYATALAKAI